MESKEDFGNTAVSAEGGSKAERISPTAYGVAYFRTFTDIPFSREFFEDLRGERGLEEIRGVAEATGGKELTPMFEARYKMVNQILKERGTNQILEIAAGFSPRGLVMSQTPEVQYVEMDLPGVIDDKEEFVRKLDAQGKVRARENLHLVKGNGLNEHDVLSAASLLSNEPITVLNEGLLRYLSHEEKKVLARNIKKLLEERGGVWITPDVATRETDITPKLQEQIKRNAKLVGINTEENLFESWEEAEAFFKDLG